VLIYAFEYINLLGNNYAANFPVLFRKRESDCRVLEILAPLFVALRRSLLR
jgi:hypothetical protein